MGTHPAIRRSSTRKSALALVATLALVLSVFVSTQTLSASSASADTAPPSANIPATVSTTSLPTAQMNGVAWDQVIIGDTVYVGGNFTKARPAGAAAGTSEVSRPYLLSYTLSTGALTSWAPVLNGQVRALAASPDGSRVYAVGAFTTVNGVAKNRIAAFSTATGALDTSFTASANGQVYAVAANSSAVYFSGSFTQSASVARNGGAAAVNASTSALLPWAPTLAGGRAYAMVVSPDGSKVVLGGSFTTVNGSGNPGLGMGAVNTSNGASLPWAIGTVVKDGGANSATYNLDSDGDNVYGAVYTYNVAGAAGNGNLEGGWSANWNGGTINWIETCHGDTYGVAVVANTVYYAGHTHKCDTSAGFPETTPITYYRGVAYSKQANDVGTSGVMAGRPQPRMLQFFPTFNIGSFTGQNQGPWAVSGNSNYVVYAGEFTKVNGVAQQGLSRFPSSAIGPNTSGPTISGSAWPVTANSYSSGTMRVAWPSNYDSDNQKLTYTVRRNGVTVYSTTNLSVFWDQPGNTFVDTGLTPGASYTYQVVATDPFGNTKTSASVTATAASSGTLSNYARAVYSDSPTWYYRLGESSGTATNYAGPIANTTKTNAVIQAAPATVGSGVTRSVAGAITGDTNAAMQFNGSSSSRVFAPQQTWADDSISVEAWFKTTTASGKIVGFGDSASANNSGTQDRSLYLDGGRVIWNVNDGAQRNLQSGTGMNNGAWHYVVGSVGPDGMYLYVDGVLVSARAATIKGASYWGYWHIGGDTTPAGNQNFTGAIDEVAVYKNPLSAAQVAAHYSAGRGGAVVTPPPATNAAPTASFTSSVSNLAATVNGSASTDSDGSISSYAWNFGDGSTGAGATSSHTYATAGTYTVTLTVTDNAGATGSVARSLTVTAGTTPPPATGATANDTFARTVTTGWGSAETGGAWTTTVNSNYTVSNGAGHFLLAAGTTRRAILGSVSSASTNVVAQISADKAATGGPFYLGVVGRQVGSDYYQARVRFLVGGSLELMLMHGGSTLLTNVTPGLTYSPGATLQLRLQVTGTSPTTIRAKVWPTGTTEPTAWQTTTTDSTAALQAAGSVGTEAYLSSSSTNAPVTANYDNFSVTSAQ
ncbi:hypothetical protein BH09ACT1_BH09ACT1_05760 [soil metagenome]